MPMPRRRPELPVGVDDQVPYDQSGMMDDELAPAAEGPEQAAVAPEMDLGSVGAEPAPMDLGALGGLDEVPDQGLEGLDSMGPEDAQAEQMAMALDDPSTPPEIRAELEQQLALAARRQLAGLGG